MPDTLADNTICNSQLVNVAYSTVLRAIELTDSDPFSMTIRCSIEWAAIAQCVNLGIDSRLEACNLQGIDRYDNGDCSVSPHSLCVLLRRLGDTEFHDTEKHDADDIWDAAMSLQSGIFTVLGIDEYGEVVNPQIRTYSSSRHRSGTELDCRTWDTGTSNGLVARTLCNEAPASHRF